ncbi:hypothetical protein GCM10025874_08790 [Arenivirga flava]|uniref:Protein translocase subunit SecD n=1 Tax=Arenivirga flava TaxID=1930060 RepID=A0AA37UGK2_9MICO|nr:hypothetical protein GCM10025874_08790 [Arenivirga flava]
MAFARVAWRHHHRSRRPQRLRRRHRAGHLDPELALDLQGGTQIILAPQLEDGEGISGEQLDQAVSIIRDRVDASGTNESEVTTQGGRNVVVSIPGEPDAATMERLQASAQLSFRPVLYTEAAPVSSMTDEDGDGEPDEGASASPSYEPDPSLATTPSVEPTDASDLNWITESLFDRFSNTDCATLDAHSLNTAPADEPLIACSDDGTQRYILGPVEVSGDQISDASAGMVSNQQGVSTGQWAVNIQFNGAGTDAFAAVTQRLFAFQQGTPQNQFAIVLDGAVISAPTTNAIISDGRPQISGSFTQETAQALADQLKYGALPVSFEVQSQETITATLGSDQLRSGLIAGLVGAILVIGYSLFQYRSLGLVTVASLIVASIVTYLLVNILSWSQGFRLSLAGVAGLIISIGTIADSFIVYFERVRDELRDGRGLESSVEAGWKRALRTILASDAINVIAAVVLFVVAVGNVQGFAFTLGLTTLIDVLVVCLFTHPVMQLLARTRFFGEGTASAVSTRRRWGPSTAAVRSSGRPWWPRARRAAAPARRSVARPSRSVARPSRPATGRRSPDGRPDRMGQQALHRRAQRAGDRPAQAVVPDRGDRDPRRSHRAVAARRLRARHRLHRRQPVHGGAGDRRRGRHRPVGGDRCGALGRARGRPPRRRAR